MTNKNKNMYQKIKRGFEDGKASNMIWVIHLV